MDTKFLERGGVPAEIIKRMLVEAPKEQDEKIRAFSKILEEGRWKVVLVTGPTSIDKEVFIGRLLAQVIGIGKMVYYASAQSYVSKLQPISHDKLPRAYVYAIIDATNMPTNEYRKSSLTNFIKETAMAGRFVIIDCPAVSDLESTYGMPFCDYISHISVEIAIKTQRGVICKL